MTVEWLPVEHMHQKPRRETLNFSIQWDHRLQDLPQNKHVEQFAGELLALAGSYLRNLVGETYTFPDVFNVTIASRPRHGAMGSDVYLSYTALIEGMEGDGERRDIEQSLFIHELVHHYDPDSEELAMMVELAYILEHERMERLQTLKRILQEGRLAAKYQEGLQRIAETLGMKGVEDFLDHATPNDAPKLKAVFAENMRKEIVTTVKR